MKKIITFLAILFFSSIHFSSASVADAFHYDESQVTYQLSTVSELESALNMNAVLSPEQEEAASKMKAVAPNEEPNGYRALSFLSGCCCSISGAAVVSLLYYYKTGDTEVGKESLKYGLFGSAVPVIAYVIALFSAANGNNTLSLLGI